MKILVTGSSGHLGEALIRTFRAKDIDYQGVDIKPSEFTTHTGSISDAVFVNACIQNQNIDVIIHTATLHKPHVATHTNQEFVDTNITGTLNLLEAAKSFGVKSFIFTSTTSTFGDVMKPPKGQPAVWVTEETFPIPKNIYGVTKLAAEDLCWLFYRNEKLPCLILKTSRFFPEEDDNKVLRESYEDDNCKANEFLNRRVDIEDIVQAHLLAVEKASEIGFGKYIISATTPFTQDDLMALRKNATEVIDRIYPDFKVAYQTKNWKMFPEFGRVYVNAKARKELDWQPKYDFRHILDSLKAGKDYRSPLTLEIGSRGYHDQLFEEGPYPVKDL